MRLCKFSTVGVSLKFQYIFNYIYETPHTYFTSKVQKTIKTQRINITFPHETIDTTRISKPIYQVLLIYFFTNNKSSSDSRDPTKSNNPQSPIRNQTISFLGTLCGFRLVARANDLLIRLHITDCGT